MAYISPIASGYDRLYQKSSKDSEVSRIKAKMVDVVIPRFAGGSVFDYGCSIVEFMNSCLNIPSTSWAMGMRMASNKMLTALAFSQNKVRQPKTIFAYQPNDFGWISEQLSIPLVLKTLTGSQGHGVVVVESQMALNMTLQAFSKLGVNLLMQEWIDSGEPYSDIRAYVVDQKVVSAYRRHAVAGEKRTNYSLSKSGSVIKITDEIETLAVKAANAVGLDVCAVDLIEDINDNKKLFAIEANTCGSLKGIEAVTQDNVAIEIIKYAETIGKGSARKKDDEKESKAMIMQKPHFSTLSIVQKEATASALLSNGRKRPIASREIVVKKCPLFT
ncbi:MAG: RimK family alpha-L-glutamate ligase [Candidatus Moranbacteria bacterium]|nr:RimK family alpha-L-glutamate ligase [Candidatus Moranbacteria bacterium]